MTNQQESSRCGDRDRNCAPRKSQVTKRWLLLVALGMTLLAGCGAAKTKTVVQTVTAPSSTSTTTTASPSATSAPATVATATTTTTPTTDCTALGIDSKRLREGKCAEPDGTRVNVVNKASTLRLYSLAVKLNGIRIQDSLSDSGQSATARGLFLIASITITNRLDTPQSFDSLSAGGGQTALFLGKRTYTEDFNAENGPDQQSFVANQLSSQGIQPGESQTGDIIFDVPRNAASALNTTGNLDVYNFGISAQSPSGEAGVIRTYH